MATGKLSRKLSCTSNVTDRFSADYCLSNGIRWNSDQNCTQNSARGWWGVKGVGGGRVGVVGVRG